MLLLLSTLIPIAFASPSQVDTDVPIRQVEETLPVPEGLELAAAMDVVADLPTIFGAYEPAIPWVPGVSLKLDKEVVSAKDPVILAIPVHGAVFGRPIVEVAQVLATSTPLTCPSGLSGLGITLGFQQSSHNVYRRVDRIEITACPREVRDGEFVVAAHGEMFEGHLPQDPELNALHESIGAKALQTAFMRQVPAVLVAVESIWDARAASVRDASTEP